MCNEAVCVTAWWIGGCSQQSDVTHENHPSNIWFVLPQQDKCGGRVEIPTDMGHFFLFCCFIHLSFFFNRVDQSRMNCREMDKSTVIHVILMTRFLRAMILCRKHALISDSQDIFYEKEKRRSTLSNRFFWNGHFHHIIAARTASCRTHCHSVITSICLP